MTREKEGQIIVLSQTQYPKLAAVQPQLQPTADGKIKLHITAPDMSPIIVPVELPTFSTTTVRYTYIVSMYVKAVSSQKYPVILYLLFTVILCLLASVKMSVIVPLSGSVSTLA